MPQARPRISMHVTATPLDSCQCHQRPRQTKQGARLLTESEIGSPEPLPGQVPAADSGLERDGGLPNLTDFRPS